MQGGTLRWLHFDLSSFLPHFFLVLWTPGTPTDESLRCETYGLIVVPFLHGPDICQVLCDISLVSEQTVIIDAVVRE